MSKAACPVCGKTLSRRRDDTLRRHGGVEPGEWCPGSDAPGVELPAKRARVGRLVFDWFEDVREP